MRAVALIALTCLALTACGGDDSSPAASGGSGTSNNGAPVETAARVRAGREAAAVVRAVPAVPVARAAARRTWRYEAQPVAADKASFLTLVNNEGAKGYRYLGDYYYSASNGGTQSIFVNDGTAQTYTYQLQNASADLTSFVNTANAQGSSGYRYEGPLTYGDLYRKDGGSSATSHTTTGLPTDANAFSRRRTAGQPSGYWFLGPIVVASVQANIYMKNNASSATYTYDARAASTGDSSRRPTAKGGGIARRARWRSARRSRGST